MSSIWDNTYTLGNTSATTLSAGPGIKIDDSTPGVIKVSNDETVLFSGYSLSGTLSEPVTNFEYLKLYAAQKDDTQFKCFNEIEVSNVLMKPCFRYAWHNQSNIYDFYCNYNISGDQFSYRFGGYIRTPWTGTNSVFTASADNAIVMTKIIGCNRKQNGGN